MYGTITKKGGNGGGMACVVLPLEEYMIERVIPLVAGYLNASADGLTETAPSSDQTERCERTLFELMKSKFAFCYVAQIDQEFVGFILLAWSFSISKGKPVLRIEALYTLPNYRNRGVGRRLIEFASEMAEGSNSARLQLETDDGNKPAKSLYEKTGFQFIKGKEVYMKFI